MIDNLKAIGDTVSGIVGGKSADPSLTKAPLADYSIVNKEANWFKALPYAFRTNTGSIPKIFYLPINPSNLTITTHYATNMIPTLYGTIEEHSEVRYFDINIAGTTGFVPKYTMESSDFNNLIGDNGGRTAYQSGEIFSNLAGGFFKQTLGKLDAALNSAKDTLSSIKGTGNKFQPGVSSQESGYIAFHRLYKFFLQYKKDVVSGTSGLSKSMVSGSGMGDLKEAENAIARNSSTSISTPLIFLNYKDNNQYSVVLQSFTLERSAENPMLYNYRIAMRGYNLQTIGINVDAKDFLKNRLNNLGLGSGAASIASRFKNGIKNGRATLNNLKGALGTLGK